jgi:LEA14-like dessication related protein
MRGAALRILRLILILTLTTLAFTACKTLPAAQEPVVSLHSAELADLDVLSGARLLCKVQVENPNLFAVPLPEINWELFLDANSFVKGVVKNNGQIEAKSASIIEIPVTLNYLDIFNAFAALKGKKQADYKAAFDVKSAPKGGKVWHLEHEGELPMPLPPKTGAPVMRAEKADAAMVEWYVSVNVENPNPFELPPLKIAFNYQVENRVILKNTLPGRGRLAASSVTPVVFGLAVYYVDLFRVLPELRASTGAQSRLDITFDFGVPAFSGEDFSLHIPAVIQF